MRTFTSVRFRLTAIYSLLLFGLAALVVGGVYTGLARDLDDEPVSRTYQVQLVSPEGVPIRSETYGNTPEATPPTIRTLTAQMGEVTCGGLYSAPSAVFDRHARSASHAS